MLPPQGCDIYVCKDKQFLFSKIILRDIRVIRKTLDFIAVLQLLFCCGGGMHCFRNLVRERHIHSSCLVMRKYIGMKFYYTVTIMSREQFDCKMMQK